MIIPRHLLPLIVSIFTVPSHTAVPNPIVDEPASRVKPATLPIPMSEKMERPIAPDQLRAQSPWTMSLAGNWKFQLTHGEIVDDKFVMSRAEAVGLKASSTQGGNALINAFDNNPETRWCASNGDFPQWLQVRLEEPRTITGIDIKWERSDAHYLCRIEGSSDGTHWKTLLDKSTEPGIGDGLLALPASSAVKFVRIIVLGSKGGSWASIRELKVHYQDNGQDSIWKPVQPVNVVPVHADDFVAPTFDDGKWDNLAVPSNWEMAGYSIPTYNTVDDSVGLYRRWIDVPASWSGRRIVWRFDGVLDGAEIFVNGRKAGYHESGYTAFDVDLTDLVQPGQRNLMAIRVCKTTPSYEADTGDYQSMGGIYRDTRLIAVPQTHIDDVTVQTPLLNNYHDATLNVNASIKGTAGEAVSVTGYVTDASTQQRLPINLTKDAVLGANGQTNIDLSALVSGPKLWSAEKPSLYYVTLELRRKGEQVERIQQRFGFRQIEIKNQIVLWNGQPIKTTGICRHDFWADKGFALTDNEWRKDLTMMKATNINAIRTSHYNHAARFLELCEERGFYILDEVPFCWIDDRVKDPTFAPPLLQRTAETIGRDKNRPCVLAWSLGNENPTGVNTQAVHDLAKRLDPTRPSFASGAGPVSVKGQELFDTHYPSPGSINYYLQKESSIAPEVITEHPHTFYSRETQTYDPGASDAWSEGMIATWEQMWHSPTILGSFIWEWQSQGVADKFPDHTTDFYYDLEHMRQENNKGIVDAYRNPKAEVWIVKMVYSPVVIPTRTVLVNGNGCTVPFTNRYSFTDLSELKIQWTAFNNATIVGKGTANVSCPPGQSVEAKLATPANLTSLELQIDRADGTNVTVARLDAKGTLPLMAPAASEDRSPLSISDGANALSVKSAKQEITFDKKTGTILRWVFAGQDRLAKGGPYLNLGEAKTAKGDNYFRAKQPVITSDASITATPSGDGSIHVSSRSQVRSNAGSKESLGVLTTDYVIHTNGEIGVKWSLDWAAKDMNLWEIGLCLPVPSANDRQAWSRESYFTKYPVGHIGAPTGICGPKDVAFRSSKRSLHFLSLTKGSGEGIALIATDVPLIGRANKEGNATVLYASREIAAAGPDDLSQSWFRAHDIKAAKGKPLSGEFILRAIGNR